MSKGRREFNAAFVGDNGRKKFKFWCSFFLGECLPLQKFLMDKPEFSCWFPIKIMDALLRGFAQVVFANNPISGIFVIAGLAIADLRVCAAGLVAATTATLTAVLFRQPWTSIGNGLMTYNGVLVGTVTASLSPPLILATAGPAYLPWLLILMGSFISVLVTSGLGNLCKGVSIPPMTVPFNLIDLLIFVALPQVLGFLADQDPNAVYKETIPMQTITNETKANVDWLQVARGGLVSMGQVYAVEDVACSIVMYVGVSLFSPFLAVALFGGSFLASICGVGLSSDLSSVYSGLWGYNSALTAGAIAATFYVPTALSLTNAALAVCFTAASQRAFSLVLSPAKLPVLTIPFVTTSAIFLAVSSGKGCERLYRTTDGKPAELQRLQYSSSEGDDSP